MKKIYGLVAMGLLLLSPAMADHRVIDAKELPHAARTFLERHFNKEEVSHITVDRDVLDNDYKVVFASGATVEFDKQGAWTEVDCKTENVPMAIVPKPIRNSIDERFGGQAVQKIERDRHGYEVRLANGLDLEYNHRFHLVEVDD